MTTEDTEKDRPSAAIASTALIVGPGDHFLSGISYYTTLLTAALDEHGPVALMQLRRLCPRIFYPGKARVGRTAGALPSAAVPTYNGLDWFWGRSGIGAVRFWRRQRPGVVILQWWTATVLHSYLVLAYMTKRSGARLVIEFHEMQDVGEARLPLVGWYTRVGMRLLLSWVDAVVVHSAVDEREVRSSYPQLENRAFQVIPHGPYSHHLPQVDLAGEGRSDIAPSPVASEGLGPVRLLIFGVVRPYKGHAELTEAVRQLRQAGLDLDVSVVGEVWQGYQDPLRAFAGVLPADRLTIVDRYVTDEEVASFFAAADIVVLPYRRSSASGPMHIAMSWGLPVVTTSVGGLVEAADGYTGAVLVPPNDPAALADGIRRALPLIGQIHADPHSWKRSAERYTTLLNRIGARWSRPRMVASEVSR